VLFGLALLLAGVQTPSLHAQSPFNLDNSPILPSGVDLSAPASDTAPAPIARTNRIRLFRIMPGFLTDPVAPSQDDPLPSDAVPEPNSGPDNVQLWMGNDNPYFDFRKPSDPGGVGYFKLHSQVQLLDSASTSCALNLQAMTPAGRDQDGLADGPSYLVPALAIFHELNDCTAIQAYVGKQVQVGSGWTNNLNRSIHYGAALVRPLVDDIPLNLGNIYWFVGALGRYRFDADPTTYHAPTWELMPGFHWQLGENVWLACGFLVPMKQPDMDSPLWQLTCSFQF